MFVDHSKIFVKAGDGGDGCICFHREKFVPLGGPDGGDGGKGGEVIVKARATLRTLFDLKIRPHYKAASGKNGQGNNRYGRSAPPLFIYVPLGTIVQDVATGRILADLAEDGQEILVARGGRGGRGNAKFKSANRQAPRIAERGEPGAEITLNLELKLLADAGLVGYPNAGKSTLLSRISKARPKIADYPFTTLAPNLGFVSLGGGSSFVAADIPGLIAGAHRSVGLGNEFLRHVERTKVIIHLVDVFGFDNQSAWENYQSINKELKLYSPKLAQKPQVIALNKMDLPAAEEKAKQFKKHLKKKPVYVISARAGVGLQELLGAVYEELKIAPEPEPVAMPKQPQEFTAGSEFKINIKDGVFVISGKHIEKIAAMTWTEEEEALIRMHNIFKKIGVDKALKDKEIKPGDLVRSGKIEFEYTE
ncbi:MAG: GTPase ObgE [Elusimicrobia bacterium]|nr:GTPase ObgE [Elusimicrobiota bacterium]